MIRSMTGFGRGEAREDGKEFVVEVKSVNHRYNDIFIKMPRQISFLEERVRDSVAKVISRGKVDVYISYEDSTLQSNSVHINEGLATAYFEALEILRDKYGLNGDISVSLLARFPEVLKVKEPVADEEEIWQLLKNALDSALGALIIMRENEGDKLRSNLHERSLNIENILREIALRAPCVTIEYKQKLECRIKELIEQQTIDENRLSQEVAIFADKCSIDEEVVRLDSHINQLRKAFEEQQPVGRKLDFLVQEMNREVNTIGSKANDLVITNYVLELKSDIEKMREQIQNIE